MKTATYPLVHDDRDDEAGGSCIPRISLDCAACGASVVYCHLSTAVIRAYVDPKTPPWRCSSCAGAL